MSRGYWKVSILFITNMMQGSVAYLYWASDRYDKDQFLVTFETASYSLWDMCCYYISYFLSFYYTTIRTQYLPSKHLEVDQKGLGSSDANGSPPLIHFHRLILLLPLHMTRLIVKRLSTERRDLPQLHLRRRVFRRQPLRLCFLHPIG